MTPTQKYGEKVSKIRMHYKEKRKQLKLVYEDDGGEIPFPRGVHERHRL